MANTCDSGSGYESSSGKKKGGVGEEEGFAEFWAAYPRKTAKKAALKAWHALAPPPELRQSIHTALDRQKTSQQWQDATKIPHAATWLNGERWNDVMPDAGQTAETTAQATERRIAETRQTRAEMEELNRRAARPKSNNGLFPPVEDIRDE